MAFANDIESIVVQYLHSAQPSLGSERIEAALRKYIDQLDDEARSRILPGWKKPGKKGRKPYKPSIKELDDIERDALAYLNQKQRQRALHDEDLKPTVDLEAVLGAVAALRDGLSWNVQNKIEDLWAAEESVITSDRFKRSSPAERLTMLYESSISTAYWSEYKRRMTALLIQHVRKQDRKSTSNAATEKTQKLRTLAGRSLANAKCLSLTANAWLRFVGVWGLGGLVMPGPGQQRAFEHALSPDHFKDLWDFCKEKIPDITDRVHRTHETVRRLLIRAIQICEGDEEALRSGQGRLANAYRTRWENNNSDTLRAPSNLTTFDTNSSPSVSVGLGRTPLEILAEVARSQPSNDYDEGPYIGGARSTPPLPVARAQDDGSVTARVQTQSSDQVSTSSVVGACNLGTNTGQVQTSESREAAPVPTAMYGQAMNSPWRTNWPQQTATHHVPLNGAHDLPLFGFGQGSMTMGAGAVRLQDGSNPRVNGLYVGPSTDVSGASNDHPPDHAVRTPGFQETNTANNETSKQAHSSTTDAAYDQALHSSLAQFGDGTTGFDTFWNWEDLTNVLHNDLGEGFDEQ